MWRLNSFSRAVLSRLLLAIVSIAPCAEANPKSKIFRESPEVVLKAAQKAAEDHTIVKISDADSRVFSDDSEDVLSFAFVSRISGFTPSVVAIVNISKSKEGGSQLELFYHRQGIKSVWIPSAAYEALELEYETDLQKILTHIDNERELLEFYWKTGKVNHADYYAQQRALAADEHKARLNELDLVYKAKMEDIAQMPRSTFAAMDAAADRYFTLVEKILKKANQTLSFYTSSGPLVDSLYEANANNTQEFHVSLEYSSDEQKADVILEEKVEEGQYILSLRTRDRNELLHKVAVPEKQSKRAIISMERWISSIDWE